jgi:hypothetical protein
MKDDLNGEKLKGMEEMIGCDMNELLPPETDKYFYLIRYDSQSWCGTQQLTVDHI